MADILLVYVELYRKTNNTDDRKVEGGLTLFVACISMYVLYSLCMGMIILLPAAITLL